MHKYLKTGGQKIVAPNGDEYYGYTQEEVDASYAKKLKEQQKQEKAERERIEKEKAEVLADLQQELDNLQNRGLQTMEEEAKVVVPIIHHYFERFSEPYCAYMFFTCYRWGWTIEQYMSTYPPPERWYYSYKDDYYG